MKWKGCGRKWPKLKVLFQHYPGGIEENHRIEIFGLLPKNEIYHCTITFCCIVDLSK
jgi:hypothetical protein